MRSFLPPLSILAASLALVRATPSAIIPAGTIHGMTCSNGASAFLSVPFAIPPTGDLRWTSPQAYNETFPASGYNATFRRAICVQFGGAEFTDPGPEDEDCLYLNIWVPPNTAPTSKLPVKVWIYGGGQQGGGIQNPLFDGCNLAAHNTLLVSISYRLGPLGYFTLDSAGIGGNFGTQDLILGLEWVQSNIAAFGGDPKKVVLFGESAGASNVFLLSTLPKATSLFNAAIWQSGAGPQLATSEVANSLGTAYAAKLNCTTNIPACLRSVLKSVLNATAPEGDYVSIYSGLNPVDFQPHVDGTTIPAQPWSVGPKVPMIFGSNADEGGLFTLGTFKTSFASINATQYATFLSDNFGPAASLISKQYPLSAFNTSRFPEFEAINTIITQAQFTCPLYQAMLKAQENNIPVYTYLNSHIPTCQWTAALIPAAIQLVGATHTSDIPFVFGNGVNQPLSSSNGTCNFTTQEVAISETLIAAWSAMASTGNPSVPGGLQWPRWNSNTSMGVNILNATSVRTIDYSQCAFWDMIDNTYLNFTDLSLSGNGMNGTSSGNTTSKGNSAERGVETRILGLTLALWITIAVLMG